MKIMAVFPTYSSTFDQMGMGMGIDGADLTVV